MTRRFASHARRIRANIDIKLQLVETTKEPAASGDRTGNTDDAIDRISDGEIFALIGPLIDEYSIFNFLESSDGVEYKPAWKKQRTKGEIYYSRTREVYLDVGGDTAYGWLTYNNKYGLTLNTKSPFVDELIARVCMDVRAVIESKGLHGDPRPFGIAYQYEEICTWLPDDALEKVIRGLPYLIRYAETMDWKITHAEAGRELIIHRLALSWPRLYPDSAETFSGFVRLAVKLYKTASHNQPYKLEFQVEVPGREGGGKPLPADQWEKAVRATCLKLMDAFLEFCGVDDTFIWSGQAGKVRELTHIPYEPAMLADLRGLEGRPAIALPVFFVESLRRRLDLDKEKPQDQAILNLLRSFKRVECGWGLFYPDFTTYMLDTVGKGQDDVRLAVLMERVRGLRPTRDNLFYLDDGIRKNTKSSTYRAVLSKQLIQRLGLVEGRKHSRHAALLRLTNKAF